MTIQLAGCILLDSSKRILLIHRQTSDYNHWEVPGGKRETGESAEQTAKRELNEELGLKVSIKQKLGETIFEDKGRTFSYTWFLASSDDKPGVKEPHIFTEAKYFKPEELKNGEISLSEGAKHFALLLKRGEITL